MRVTVDVVPSNEEEKLQGMGAFRIVRRLPASSRDVYLAVSSEGAQVVLKVFGAPQRNQGLFDPKIADEASAYARLSHPNIVKVLDMFSADGQFVIALEYVDGSNLGVVRATLDRTGHAVPDACWLYVMHCVFSALAEAHKANDAGGKPAPVIHRGVNPSNVLIGWDGDVKLGNFNIAQSVRVLRDSNPGLSWGSYGYFAPEQVKLETVASQTDVYSATLVLWELLAGRKGIERASLPDTELLKAMATPTFTPLEKLRGGVSAPVRYAVRAGLEPDPKRRFVDAGRIRDVLRAAVDLDAARSQLVELLVYVRESEKAMASVSPPVAAPTPVAEPAAIAPGVETALAPEAAHTTPALDAAPAPPVEVISLMPDPVPDAPPLPVVPPPPEMPAIELPKVPATPDVPVLTLHQDTRGRRLRVAVLTVTGAAVGLILVGALVHHLRASAAASPPSPIQVSAASVAVATPQVIEPATSPTSSAPPIVEPPAEASSGAVVLPTHGQLVPSAAASGHRIYIDNRVVGDGNKSVDVACGRHTLRIGSHGKPQSIDVPCGGVFTLE